MNCYVGIDVACGRNKPLPICVGVREQGRFVPLPLLDLPFKPPRGRGNLATLVAAENEAYAAEVREYIEQVCQFYALQPAVIALDSPLQPRADTLDFRLAERALLDAGIRCYKTPSASEFSRIVEKGQPLVAAGGPATKVPHPMQLFMLAGFAIAKALRDVAEVIEVFPQATIRTLWPDAPHKSGEGQPLLQLARIAQLSGWPADDDDREILTRISAGRLHDKVDAYSAAWVASLPESQREVYGSVADEDAIWVPRVSL